MRLSLATGLQVEAPVASLLRMLRLPLRLTRNWTFQSRKTLKQIFQNLWHGILATWLGDMFATHSSREKCVFCANRVIFKTVFKNYSVSLASCACSLSCLPLPLPKSQFSLTKPPFSSSILHQSSRKGMGFLLFSKYFMFLALEFLDFVFLLRFENMMLEYGLLMFCCV